MLSSNYEPLQASGNNLPSPCAMIGLFSRINQFSGHKFILLTHDRCTADPIMRVSQGLMWIWYVD